MHCHCIAPLASVLREWFSKFLFSSTGHTDVQVTYTREVMLAIWHYFTVALQGHI